MNKDTEVARMEHEENEMWAVIRDGLLCNDKGVDVVMGSLKVVKDLINKDPLKEMLSTPAMMLLQYASMKFIREAREKELIPEQEGMDDATRH